MVPGPAGDRSVSARPQGSEVGLEEDDPVAQPPLDRELVPQSRLERASGSLRLRRSSRVLGVVPRRGARRVRNQNKGKEPRR
jgi:hypothetical protein